MLICVCNVQHTLKGQLTPKSKIHFHLACKSYLKLFWCDLLSLGVIADIDWHLKCVLLADSSRTGSSLPVNTAGLGQKKASTSGASLTTGNTFQ